MNQENDTIKLLQECDAGSKMATGAIDEVIDQISSEELREALKRNKDKHAKLGNEIHNLLSELNSDEKDPNPIAKGMSYLKTNFKLGMDTSDDTVADLITDGCDMGIKSLHRYLNKYKKADDRAKNLCSSLIKLEEELRKELQKYLC